MTQQTSAYQRLLNIGSAEGISFIILLGIAMPLKYMAGMPLPVRIVGMLHGILFVWFSIVLLRTKIILGFSNRKMILAFLLSFLPFGTFFLSKIFEKEKFAVVKAAK